MKRLPLTKKRLDEMSQYVADNGCSMPNCTHLHQPLFYFHARCHLDAPIQVAIINNEVLRISCGECGVFVADVGITPPSATILKCHNDIEVSYEKGDGFLTVSCYDCHKTICLLDVLS
jgi:hypothetical protein